MRDADVLGVLFVSGAALGLVSAILVDVAVLSFEPRASPETEPRVSLRHAVTQDGGRLLVDVAF